VESTQSPSVTWSFDVIPQRFFTDSNYSVGDFVNLVRPSTIVPSQPDPTIPYLVVPSQSVLVQVLTVDLSVNSSGDVSVKMTAVQTPQPWDAVPSTISWDDVAPSISWNDMLFTYLT
jgi:hypothetical protein